MSLEAHIMENNQIYPHNWLSSVSVGDKWPVMCPSWEGSLFCTGQLSSTGSAVTAQELLHPDTNSHMRLFCSKVMMHAKWNRISCFANACVFPLSAAKSSPVSDSLALLASEVTSRTPLEHLQDQAACIATLHYSDATRGVGHTGWHPWGWGVIPPVPKFWKSIWEICIYE